MRLIPSRLLPFDVLGLPKESITEMLHAHRGLVIVTGPTGFRQNDVARDDDRLHQH
jgi:Tfp pilus assembly pilus retraction ATPase PilT